MSGSWPGWRRCRGNRGPDGVGKTRFGLAAAAALEDEFADGVAFVSLAPVGDPDLVIQTVAAALEPGGWERATPFGNAFGLGDAAAAALDLLAANAGASGNAPRRSRARSDRSPQGSRT